MAHAKDTLRFITCGSVDDGKSTLIGRLIYDTANITDEEKAGAEKLGEGGIDYASLLDGLEDERTQGITIDVAYRYFATDKRRFIVADTPGHEQYTRNMATGASTAAAAVILIDARKGVLTQTKRHSRIVAMMGISQVILCVNKMDLIGFDQKIFAQIADDYRAFAATIGLAEPIAVPISALQGDNVCTASARMPWHKGGALLARLDALQVPEQLSDGALRLPVQSVSRLPSEGRGFQGRIAQGQVNVGAEVRLMPSGVTAGIKDIVKGFESVSTATAGESVMLMLNEERDVSRGDVIVSASQPCDVADQFQARLLWMSEQKMSAGRQYVLKIHAKTVPAFVTEIKYREDPNSGEKLSAKMLDCNDIAEVTISTGEPVAFEPYTANRTMGGFILIDKFSNETVAAGMIRFSLYRAKNIHWQAVTVTAATRASQKNQQPRCIWFTGLSGAGKSTLANLIDQYLHAAGKHAYVLDGDNVRHGLNRDLGFSEADRVENIRRVAEVARLMYDAGLIVLVSFISPYRHERAFARSLFPEGGFLEVFVDAPLSACEARDVKGLYAKARKGEMKNFTGIDSEYQAPENPDIHLHTDRQSPEECVAAIVKALTEREAR